MPRTPPARVAYSITEIAEMTGRSRSTVYRWLERGALKAVRVGKGGKQMVTAASLEKLLKGEPPKTP